MFWGFKMNAFKKVGAVAVGALASVKAFAVETAFTTAVTTITADVTSYATALVGVAAVGVGFMVAVKYVKKIRGAA